MSEEQRASEGDVPAAVRQAVGARYEIERRVGQGAIGTVYRARDRELDRPVGIKVLHGSTLQAESARERLFREVTVVASLGHPNILAVHDVREVDGLVFQVREWIDGATLQEILRERGRLALDDALALGVAVAGALRAAHARGLVHRDVKPSNVLIPEDDGFDFEAARLVDFEMHAMLEPATGLTRVGDLFGTPFYMAPEQITAGAQSTATDVYGLGAVLYEAIVGAHPFDASNMAQLMMAVLQEPARFPPDVDVPREVADFVLACLEKDPERRPARPGATLEALRSAAAPGAGGAPVAPPASVGGFGGAVAHRAERPAAAPAPAGARGSPLVWAVPTALAVALLVFAFLRVGAPQAIGWPQVTPAFGDFSLGLALLLAGVAVGVLVHRWLARKGAGLRRRADPVLVMGASREELSRSMAVMVSEVVAQCEKVDEKFLGVSVALMVDQLRTATSFSDRKDALLTAMDLMERLRDRQTPWWVRHDKLVAAAVAMAGVLTGVVKMVDAFRAS